MLMYTGRTEGELTELLDGTISDRRGYPSLADQAQHQRPNQVVDTRANLEKR